MVNPLPLSAAPASADLKANTVVITIASAMVLELEQLSCDLSYDYVKINAEHTT